MDFGEFFVMYHLSKEEQTFECPECGNESALDETYWLDRDQTYIHECTNCGTVVSIN